MNEKLLLLNSAYKSRHIIHFPLGIAYVAGACDKEGIEVECIDMNFMNGNNQVVFDVIRKKGFYIIGIGGFITQIKSTMELAKTIKKQYKDVTIIVGGIQTFGCEQFILNNSDVDIVCSGESEITLPRLVHALYSGKDVCDIPSILYRRSGKIIRKDGFSIISDIDTINFPKYDAFQIDRYIKNNYHSAPGRRTIDFICSRGCPYKCNYCINSGKPVKVRYRSPENIIKEIRLLKEKYGINDFSFGDEIFEINKKKALEICEAIKTETISWITSCRADGIDDELLCAMKRAGCRMLLIGFESGSEKILRSMNKKVEVKTYSNAVRLLRKYDMQFYANFMIGMPEENEETVKETEKFCIDNNLIFGAAYVTPFPGTKLYDDVRQKIIDEKKYLYSLGEMDFSKEPVINLTEMSIKKLIFIRNCTVINTMANIICRRLKVIPLPLIKAMCWCYLYVFNIRKSSVSKIMHTITKSMYTIFSKGK